MLLTNNVSTLLLLFIIHYSVSIQDTFNLIYRTIGLKLTHIQVTMF